MSQRISEFRKSLKEQEKFVKENMANPYIGIPVRLLVVFLYFMSGTLFYHTYEGWDPFTALFFTLTTISTVGYGYQYPTDNTSRLFTIFYILVGVFVIFAGIQDVLGGAFGKLNTINSSGDQSSEKKSTQYSRRMLLSVLAIFVCMLFGAFVFMATEGWSFVEAFYFAVETSTTVGYGDLDIQHQSTTIFLLFYIVFSTVLVAYAVNSFAALQEEKAANEKIDDLLIRRRNLNFLAELDSGGGVTKDKFIIEILLHLGTIDQTKDIDPWLKKFDEIDTDKSGTLEREELEMFAQRESIDSKRAFISMQNAGSFTASLRNRLAQLLGYPAANSDSSDPSAAETTPMDDVLAAVSAMEGGSSAVRNDDASSENYNTTSGERRGGGASHGFNNSISASGDKGSAGFATPAEAASAARSSTTLLRGQYSPSKSGPGESSIKNPLLDDDSRGTS